MTSQKQYVDLADLGLQDDRIYFQLRNIALFFRRKQKIFCTRPLEEFISDLYLKFLDCRRAFKPELGKFSTYFFQAINLSLYSKYKKQFFKSLKLEPLNFDAKTGTKVLEKMLIFDPEFEFNFLEDLKNSEKELINSYFFKGETYREIGIRLGVSHEAIRLRINKILDKLREKFK